MATCPSCSLIIRVIYNPVRWLLPHLWRVLLTQITFSYRRTYLSSLLNAQRRLYPLMETSLCLLLSADPTSRAQHTRARKQGILCGQSFRDAGADPLRPRCVLSSVELVCRDHLFHTDTIAGGRASTAQSQPSLSRFVLGFCIAAFNRTSSVLCRRAYVYGTGSGLSIASMIDGLLTNDRGA